MINDVGKASIHSYFGASFKYLCLTLKSTDFYFGILFKIEVIPHGTEGLNSSLSVRKDLVVDEVFQFNNTLHEFVKCALRVKYDCRYCGFFHFILFFIKKLYALNNMQNQIKKQLILI